MLMNRLKADNPLEFFKTLFGCYESAIRSAPDELRYFYRVGACQIALHFAGSALVESVTRSLSHLASDVSGASPDLRVYLFDSVSTGTEIPGCSDLESFHGRLIHYSNEAVHSFYHAESDALMVVNSKTHEALYWIRDIRNLHVHERCIPLRTIFHWWFRLRGKQLVHAAAVGSKRKGVLIAGHAGAGKSTTALLSLKRNLFCAGDDFVLFGTKPLRVYSLSHVVKIGDGSVRIVSEEFPDIRFPAGGSYDKYWIYLNEQWPQKLAAELPLDAVFIPKLRLDQEDSCLEEIAPFRGLMEIAPSTVIPLAGAHQNDLRNVADLVRKVPNYILWIGRDRRLLCDLIEDYISR